MKKQKPLSEKTWDIKTIQPKCNHGKGNFLDTEDVIQAVQKTQEELLKEINEINSRNEQYRVPLGYVIYAIDKVFKKHFGFDNHSQEVLQKPVKQNNKLKRLQSPDTNIQEEKGK